MDPRSSASANTPRMPPSATDRTKHSPDQPAHPVGSPNPETILVWQADLSSVEAALDSLSPEERKRAAKLARPEIHNAFVASRIFLRQTLSLILHCCPSKLQIKASPTGKPHLPDHPHLHFNLSHCGFHALLAIASAPIGVDLENTDRSLDCIALAQRFFHTNERQAVTTSLTPNKEFFTIWTAKEACLKAVGIGLRTELSSFDVSDILFSGTCTVSLHDDRSNQMAIFARALPLPGAAACVASTRPISHVTLQNWFPSYTGPLHHHSPQPSHHAIASP